METQTQALQAAVTPEGALEKLKEGNIRFTKKRMADRDLPQQVLATSNGQYPFAVVLGCIDSRVPPELIFDQGIGDIFSVRIAGNFVNADILGSLEFACRIAGAKVVLVLGHTRCGAITSACEGIEIGNLTGMLSKLKPAVEAVAASGEARSTQNAGFIRQVAEKNVELTVEAIRQRSPVLIQMVENGEIAIVGAMYDVETGEVTFC